jgi:hypothetical protein
VVAGHCRGLQIPRRQGVFCSLFCPLLQGIACGLGSYLGQHALTGIVFETIGVVALTLVILLAVLLSSRRTHP